jgi:hypothetical protein
MSSDPAAGARAGEPQSAAPGPAGGESPSEAELRASYEAELSRITSTDMILQAAVSLLNIAAHRLGPPSAPEGASGATTPSPPPERDMEQVRDGIDAVRALLEILERRIPAEVRPLRDALSRLQLAYAREAPSAGAPAPAGADPGQQAGAPTAQPEATGPSPAGPAGEGAGEDSKEQPGPAQASGRLWVPGR